MPTFDSGRAASLGGINIRNKRASDLTGIRFADNRTAAPTSANDMVLYRVSNSLRFWDGTTEYNLLTSVSGSVGDLNGVYENGRTITVDEGAIVLNDGQATANTLTATKTGTGSGHIFSLKFEDAANTAARAIYIDMDDGIAAEGIEIDSGTTARTGSDIVFTDDSTGAHSVLDINSSGSGATIGFDFVGSYEGNAGGQVFLVDLNDADNLTTEIMQVTTGTGDRGIMFDLNFGHTDSATTSHIFDIDIGAVVFDSNIIDVAYGGASTGNTIFVNLDNAVAATALHIEGSGTRTAAMVEISSDAVGSSNMVTFAPSGATWSGHVLRFDMSAATTGDVLNVDMDAALGGRFLFLDAGGGARSANLIDVTYNSTGNVDFCEINDSNTGTQHVFDINVSGAGSGNVLDITYSTTDTGDALKVVMADNVAGGALVVTGAGARTDSLVDIVTSETGSLDGIVLISGVAANVFTGHMLTIVSPAANTTGGLLHLDLDAGVAYRAITFDHAGARTVATILATFDGTFGSGGGGTFLDANITMTGALASSFLDIDVGAIVYTGHILDIVFGAGASTGDAININLGATAVASQAMVVASGNMIRTTALFGISDGGASTGAMFDIDRTAANEGIMFDIDDTAVATGNVFDYATNSASTGTIFNVTLANAVGAILGNFTLSGTRTADAIVITDSSAGAVDVFQYTGTSTSSGHIFNIDVGNGIFTGNVFDVTFSTAASTGEAIMLAMGTNVAGRAIAVTSAGTGVSGEGNVLDVTHTGALAAGADVINITTSGVLSATSNVLAIETTNGANGSYAIYISAGNDMEGIHVDAGTVLIDETLTVTGAAATGALTVTGAATVSTTLAVTGATTLSSTLSFRALTEVVTGANTILAAESGTVFFLNAAGGFTSTLPAVAAGLVFRFVVQTAPTTAYIIATDGGANIMIGGINELEVDTGDDGPYDNDADTLNFVANVAVAGDWVEFVSNGTSWYYHGQTNADGGITTSTT